MEASGDPFEQKPQSSLPHNQGLEITQRSDFFYFPLTLEFLLQMFFSRLDQEEKPIRDVLNQKLSTVIVITIRRILVPVTQ